MTPAALRELEKRLKHEPDNLGLRVALACALHDTGRHAEAVELYRSVAMAYRDQGRTQQAIAVCRSILEIAPDDEPCKALLGTLAPVRRSSYDETPLPGPLPYHVADPTTRSLKKLSSPELDGTFTLPEIKAIRPPEAESDVETRKRPRIEKDELAKIARPPPAFGDDDDAPTTPPGRPETHDTEEEVTVPRDETGKPVT